MSGHITGLDARMILDSRGNPTVEVDCYVDGTIRGYTVREGGVGLTALVRIKVSPGAEIGSFASEVTGWDGIEIIYEVSGSADLVALVHVDDTMALRTLLDKMWLAAPNEIASTTTELVLEQY